jgi:zinc transport system permease protein
VATAVAGAVAVELLRQFGRATGDVGLAVLFYGGLAAGVLMSGIAGAGAGALSAYLFGSLTSVTASDLVVVGVLAVLVLVPTVGLTPQLFAVTSDEEFARVQGLPVRFYNLLVVVLAAVTVTVAMRTVGLLLVSALMVVPVATARNLVSGFVAALALAMALGVAVSVGGAALSFSLDTAPGALIVVLAIGVFALSWPFSVLLARRRRVNAVPPQVRSDAAEPESAEHPHLHSAACGHETIQHGDHVDYLHDGHRHAAHADHYDEH